MNWLLWREYRANAPLLIAGAALLLLPYVFTVIVLLWTSSFHSFEIAEGFTVAAMISFFLSQLTIALLGGNAIAGERADRSAEFLAYLPVSKTRRAVSKLTLALLTTAVIWGFNLLALWGLTKLGFFAAHGGIDMKYTAVTGLVMFGVGWFLSSLQSSPALAVCAGIAVPLVTLIGLVILEERLSIPSSEFEDFAAFWYTAISASLGITGLLIGTGYFLKRIEP